MTTRTRPTRLAISTLAAIAAAATLPAASQAATISQQNLAEPIVAVPWGGGAIGATGGGDDGSALVAQAAECEDGDHMAQETPGHIYIYECRGGKWVVVLIGHRHPGPVEYAR